MFPFSFLHLFFILSLPPLLLLFKCLFKSVTLHSSSVSGLSEWLADTGLEKISAQPAKLNAVNHKVVMETAPEGNQYPSDTTTASHLTYRVDRPFIYLIRDEASGALLFIGRVVNPKSLTI